MSLFCNSLFFVDQNKQIHQSHTYNKRIKFGNEIIYTYNQLNQMYILIYFFFSKSASEKCVKSKVCRSRRKFLRENLFCILLQIKNKYVVGCTASLKQRDSYITVNGGETGILSFTVQTCVRKCNILIVFLKLNCAHIYITPLKSREFFPKSVAIYIFFSVKLDCVTLNISLLAVSVFLHPTK